MSDQTPILPAHIEETVQAIARLHADHRSQARPLQRVVDRMTARAGRPEFVAILAVLVCAWVGLNLLMMTRGGRPVDAPPFYWMQGVVSLTALGMTALILTTQRREDQLAEHREQLTLELAILSEQKAAKIISLLEELRRDSPNLRDRDDPEAEALSTAADPQAVLDAIKDSHESFSAENILDDTADGAAAPPIAPAPFTQRT